MSKNYVRYIHKDSDLNYEQMTVSSVTAVIFVHFALMPLQKGLQAAHVISDIIARIINARELMGDTAYSSVDHKGKPIQYPALVRNVLTDQWLHKDKTILIKNGGNTAKLDEINKLLIHSDLVLMFPVGNFFEDQETMGGIRTGVGILLPNWILELAEDVRNGYAELIIDANTDHSDVKLCLLIQLLATTSLAQ